MKIFKSTRQVDGNTVPVIEKHYSDGSVTETLVIEGSRKTTVLAVGKGAVGKVFSLFNQEYLEYERHLGCN